MSETLGLKERAPQFYPERAPGNRCLYPEAERKKPRPLKSGVGFTEHGVLKPKMTIVGYGKMGKEFTKVF